MVRAIRALNNLEAVAAELDECGASKCRAAVALCVGCFDLLHVGHLHLLQVAHCEIWDSPGWPYGNAPRRLVVALNTDESVRALKGVGRPIYSLEQRATLVSALGVVDHVVSFEGNPALVIHALRPRIYAKGDDRDLDELPERTVVEHYGGRILIVPRLLNISTTDTVNRMRT